MRKGRGGGAKRQMGGAKRQMGGAKEEGRGKETDGRGKGRRREEDSKLTDSMSIALFSACAASLWVTSRRLTPSHTNTWSPTFSRPYTG